MKSIKKGEGGFALLMAVVIAGLVVTIGAGIASIAVRQINLSTDTRESTFAFYAANTGAECAKRAYAVSNAFEIAANSTIVCNGQSVPVTRNGNTYNFSFSYAANQPEVDVTVERNDDGTFTVVSKGYNTDAVNAARKVERKVQVVLPTKGACAKPGDVMLVLDVSGSFDQSELDLVQDAAKLMASRLSGSELDEADLENPANFGNIPDGSNPADQLIRTGLVYFGAGAKEAQGLSFNHRGLVQTLHNAHQNTFNFWVGSASENPPPGTMFTTYEAPFDAHPSTGTHGDIRNGTNLAAALLEAARELQENGRPGVPHSIILLTDGVSNRSCFNGNINPSSYIPNQSLQNVQCLNFQGSTYACDYGPFHPGTSGQGGGCDPVGQSVAGQNETIPFADYIRNTLGMKIFVVGINDQGVDSDFSTSTMLSIIGGTYPADELDPNDNFFPIGGSMIDLVSIIKDELTVSCVPPPPQYGLTVNKAGSGTGTVTGATNPPGNTSINCGTGAGCTAQFDSGKPVILTATPNANAVVSWGSGDCDSGGGNGMTCTVTMTPSTGSRTVDVSFDIPAPQPSYTVSLEGGFSNTIYEAPAQGQSQYTKILIDRCPPNVPCDTSSVLSFTGTFNPNNNDTATAPGIAGADYAAPVDSGGNPLSTAMLPAQCNGNVFCFGQGQSEYSFYVKALSDSNYSEAIERLTFRAVLPGYQTSDNEEQVFINSPDSPPPDPCANGGCQPIDECDTQPWLPQCDSGGGELPMECPRNNPFDCMVEP